MILNANAGRIPLATDSVHAVVTSPPYYDLRDYGLGEWIGGDPGCDHLGPPKASSKSTLKNDGRPADKVGSSNYELAVRVPYGRRCKKCGATREGDPLGLEPTPQAFIESLVDVFREVKRVLRPDGSAWVNMGDTYRNKHKLLIPHRLAIALADDGWIVRQDVVWWKPNAMPEPGRDRPGTDHEYVFLLSQAERGYYYDPVATMESGSYPTAVNQGSNHNGGGLVGLGEPSKMRYKRSVWKVPTLPTGLAHFATYPPNLIEPMIQASTSEWGVCPECGAQWTRIKDVEFIPQEDIVDPEKLLRNAEALDPSSSRGGSRRGRTEVATLGWAPGCDHGRDPVPAVVFDPFLGAGSTAISARALGRRWVGTELSPDYARLAWERLELDKWERFHAPPVDATTEDWTGFPLFGGHNE